MPTRLPIPGSDDGQWGAILNDFLAQAHNADGSLKPLTQSQITNLTADLAAKAKSSDLASVATSGSYTDLSDKPTIPDTSNLVSNSTLDGASAALVGNAASQTSSALRAALVAEVNTGDFAPAGTWDFTAAAVTGISGGSGLNLSQPQRPTAQWTFQDFAPRLMRGQDLDINVTGAVFGSPYSLPVSASGWWDVKWSNQATAFFMHVGLTDDNGATSGGLGVGVRAGKGVVVDNKGRGGIGAQFNLQDEYSATGLDANGQTITTAQMAQSVAAQVLVNNTRGMGLNLVQSITNAAPALYTQVSSGNQAAAGQIFASWGCNSLNSTDRAGWLYADTGILHWVRNVETSAYVNTYSPKIVSWAFGGGSTQANATSYIALNGGPLEPGGPGTTSSDPQLTLFLKQNTTQGFKSRLKALAVGVGSAAHTTELQVAPQAAEGSEAYQVALAVRASVSGANPGIGFLGATPAARQALTGSRGGNAALASLITALATLGLVTDGTTA